MCCLWGVWKWHDSEPCMAPRADQKKRIMFCQGGTAPLHCLLAVLHCIHICISRFPTKKKKPHWEHKNRPHLLCLSASCFVFFVFVFYLHRSLWKDDSQSKDTVFCFESFWNIFQTKFHLKRVTSICIRLQMFLCRGRWADVIWVGRSSSLPVNCGQQHNTLKSQLELAATELHCVRGLARVSIWDEFAVLCGLPVCFSDIKSKRMLLILGHQWETNSIITFEEFVISSPLPDSVLRIS